MGNTNKNQIERLLELKTLYEKGILTKEELEVEKKKILGKIAFNDSSSFVQPQKETPSPEMNQETAVKMDDVDYSISDECVPSKNKYYLIGTIAVILIVAGFILFPKLKNRDTSTEIGSASEINLATIVDACNVFEGYNVILSERKLTEDDLSGKSKEELRLLRNMIYARYGYRFKSDDLFQHFSQFSWYNPTTSDGSFVYGKMSEIEKYNIDFIKQHEQDLVKGNGNLYDDNNSQVKLLERKLNSASWVKHTTGFSYPDFFASSICLVEDIPGNVEVYSWEAIKLCYWPLLGNWSTSDDFPYEGNFLSPTDKVKNVTYRSFCRIKSLKTPLSTSLLSDQAA